MDYNLAATGATSSTNDASLINDGNDDADERRRRWRFRWWWGGQVVVGPPADRPSNRQKQTDSSSRRSSVVDIYIYLIVPCESYSSSWVVLFWRAPQTTTSRVNFRRFFAFSAWPKWKANSTTFLLGSKSIHSGCLFKFHWLLHFLYFFIHKLYADWTKCNNRSDNKPKVQTISPLSRCLCLWCVCVFL